jgi:hypothetical protein
VSLTTTGTVLPPRFLVVRDAHVRPERALLREGRPGIERGDGHDAPPSNDVSAKKVIATPTTILNTAIGLLGLYR